MLILDYIVGLLTVWILASILAWLGIACIRLVVDTYHNSRFSTAITESLKAQSYKVIDITPSSE